MSLRSKIACLWFFLLLATNHVLAQPTVRSLQPRSCRPGETTRLTITGKDLAAGFRIATSCGRVQVAVHEATSQQATVDLALPADAPLGPLGVWVATSEGSAEAFVLMVDDLPPVSESDDHHLPQAAQPIPTLAAVSGVSDGAKSDYYRIQVAKDQRVAFEILTQPLESAMDPVIRLLSTTGETLHLADDDQVGPECRFAHRFSDAGDYLIEVRDSRYAAGGAYYLRIGDFPILSHAYPLAVTAGQPTSVRFAGADGIDAEPRQMELPAPQLTSTVAVATRLPGGQSSAWVPLHVVAAPSYVEADAGGTDGASAPVQNATTAPPLAIPVVISGRLVQPRQHDDYFVRAAKGDQARFRARTRSLGSAALLRMRLFNVSGKQVAETAVTDADEWSFDYTFPDDGVYRLQVTDLLGRGGDNFGYCAEIAPAGTFAVEVKPDAKLVQQFAIQPGQGACAIDLQVQRFGYDGGIQLTLDGEAAGLRILNPHIGASVGDARVYLTVDDRWKADSIAVVGLVARAEADPAMQCRVGSIGWQRAKKPHVPFPAGWRDGQLVLSGVPSRDAPFALEHAGPLRLARSIDRHTLSLKLKRVAKEFKAPVVVLPDALPAGWQMEVKAEKDDVYTATLSRSADAAAPPQQVRLLAFAEHQNRGRVEAVDVPLEWFDPLRVNIEPVEPLVAGGSTMVRVSIERQGDDPQPVNVALTDLPGGLVGPEAANLTADQDHVEFQLQVPADTAASDGAVIAVTASSEYRGEKVTVTGHSAALSIVPLPVRLEVYPEAIELNGAKDRRQLLVTGFDNAQSPRDWTRDVQLTSGDPQVAEVRGTTVFAKSNGETQIVVALGDERQQIPVRVSGMEQASRTAFESEVLVALSKQGCNSGACHGSPSGKGMFRLSLRAFDRKLDQWTLIREEFGRRVNPIDPDQSLLLLKPLMKTSHGGGKRLHPGDAAHAILRDWIAEGARADPPDAPRCVKLEVFPHAKRVLRLGTGPQQLAAVAHFSDGSRRDVTHLVAYESSNMQVGTVDQHGLVTPIERGETVILVRFLEHIESVPLMFVQPAPDFQWQAPPPNNYIDELVNAKLQQMQYLPSDTCTDAEFFRRVHLDVIGLLPSVDQTQAFLNDTRSDRRARLIDDLLQRDEFAKFWALKWGDLLMMTGQQAGDEGVYKYHRWVEESLRSNMPYDQFARQLITASGSTLANPPANFYRTASDRDACVETVSQIFLGARLQCAKCHNHPFERWTQDNYYALGAFFHRVQRRNTQRPGEMFIWTSDSGDVTQPRTGQQMTPWLPGQGDVAIDDQTDRRLAFAEWLTGPDNPYFAKMEANRIWAQFFARGIVDPIDDFRDSNPPTNEALLEALAKDFATHGFDRRHLIRTILNSRTYQASHRAHRSSREDRLYFSHQQPRMLDAEQLFDAINQTMGLQPSIGGLPTGTKATQLPAPDLVKIDFLKTFGQPERSTVCACERADDSNLGMAIELFNGSTIHEKLGDANNRFRQGLASGKFVPEIVAELYLASLCRLPSDTELRAAVDHCQQRGDAAAGLEDVCWALLNTDEFLFQH